MKIKDDFRFDDLVTGLKFKIVAGKKLDRLEIENIPGGKCYNRSLWFTKDGDFDGTGSRVNSCEANDIDPAYETALADHQIDFSKKT